MELVSLSAQKTKKPTTRKASNREKNGGEGRSGWETNQASYDMHDWSWWFHWLSPLRE